MNVNEQKAAAKAFAAEWKGKGDEKQDTQRFWMSFLQRVLGVPHPEDLIKFEVRVQLEHTSFIDAMIPSTKVLIEQKGMNISLTKGIKQSDGAMLTPYQQARRYYANLPHDMNPRWIIVCNFQSFEIHDMNRPNDEPEVIRLDELEKEYYRFNFIIEAADSRIKKEMEISIKAGEIVGQIYEAFLKQYGDEPSEDDLKHLNKLCVRLVFCLYAEDAGLFGRRNMFHDYLAKFDTKAMRRALIELFNILNTPEDKRDRFLEDDLAQFPYVNGSLFEGDNAEIPHITEDIRDLLLEKASDDFDWSEISPTIFGAVFESTLNPETRRSGGMHYTSIENIHKVIDPLFLDELKNELAEIEETKALKTLDRKLEEFRTKLSTLKFLDPACGSGNFLTETYLSLRRLENRAIELGQHSGEIGFDIGNIIRVNISQFYGIEINDFAVSVAKTALWIAESQMMLETEQIIRAELDFLPLKTNAYIVEGNALRIDWESVVPKSELNYIMGNPPFVGYSLQTGEQKDDILSVLVDEKGKPYKCAGKVDYVAGWYYKAAQLMKNTQIRCALVSTNSITQGEQVASIWKPLYERFGIHIDFAHRTFRWDSEASIKAHVHCVIVGFSSAENRNKRMLFTSEKMQLVDNINPYLMDAPNVFIDSRSKSLCDVPPMIYGNKPTDGGFFFLTQQEFDELKTSEPNAAKYVRQIYGATEFINNKPRYCLWLVNASPVEIHGSKFIKERIDGVREFRINSTKKETQISAETPTLFQEIRQPNSTYIIVPRHSSQTRKYIPMGFIEPDIVVNDAVQIIPDATLYNFGVLTSNVHMAWMRAVCGRLKSDYRYSKDIVYNNFPWPEPSEEQKARIEKTAQAILDARAKYPDCSLADLYDDFMPAVLRTAHQANDRAVMEAYGFWGKYNTESACVAELMKLYEKLSAK